MFAHGVHFEDFDDIRSRQVLDRLARWLSNDRSTVCSVAREEVLDGDEVNVWIERFQISANLPPIEKYVVKLRDWRGKSHAGLVNVFENTWKKESHQTWEYWRDREAASWGPLVIPIYIRELEKQDDILSGRRQPAGPHEMEPHPFITLIHEIAGRIESAGCPRTEKLQLAFRFLASKALATSPFRQIAGSMYACLAKKASTQVKPPTQGFHNDVDVMSCLLPYCDAMFMDKECAAYWLEIQTSAARRTPYATRVFSLTTKLDFLSHLDELEQAIPDKQRRLANEVYK